MDAVPQIEIIDLKGRPCPGSLMQSVSISTPGVFRLSRRDSELYSVMILAAGARGSFWIYDGEGNDIFYQPSVFSGSFFLMAAAHKGLYVKNHSFDTVAAGLTINWREVQDEA